MKFDLLLQKNRVFIGMEDVSVTYYNEKKLEDIDQTEAMNMIREAYGNFILDDQFKNRPKRSYYPTEYQKPCRAVIIEHGILSDFWVSNFNDLRKAKEAGAVYKIDKVVLVNCERFEKFLETFRVWED